jgi:hypothetical protein
MGDVGRGMEGEPKGMGESGGIGHAPKGKEEEECVCELKSLS